MGSESNLIWKDVWLKSLVTVSAGEHDTSKTFEIGGHTECFFSIEKESDYLHLPW